jgi:hypothetical protein
MLSIGHGALMQYRLNEALGRPFDSTVNGARGQLRRVDRHPKLQVLIVHMGGGLTSTQLDCAPRLRCVVRTQ